MKLVEKLILQYQTKIEQKDKAIAKIKEMIRKARKDESIDIIDLSEEKLNAQRDRQIYLQFTKDLEDLSDEISDDSIFDTDVCYTWRCRGRYKPNIKTWSYYGSVSNKQVPQIDGYDIWLAFFCDYSGIETLIYYPKACKKGEIINVIFSGENIKANIVWRHSDAGLFRNIIYPLLFLDKD